MATKLFLNTKVIAVKKYSATIYNYAAELQEEETTQNTQALIVDDEVDICYLLKNILRQQKINADYVTSLSEAKDYLKFYEPSVIFLDNYLVDGLGINHIHEIKKEHPESKVVVITAHDNISDREKAYKEGADFFISKPFSRESIIKTLNKM